MLVITPLAAPVFTAQKYCGDSSFRGKIVVKIHKVKNIDRIILALVFSAQLRPKKAFVASIKILSAIEQSEFAGKPAIELWSIYRDSRPSATAAAFSEPNRRVTSAKENSIAVPGPWLVIRFSSSTTRSTLTALAWLASSS